MSSGVSVRRVVRPTVKTHSGSRSVRSRIGKAPTSVPRTPVTVHAGNATGKPRVGRRVKAGG